MEKSEKDWADVKAIIAESIELLERAQSMLEDNYNSPENAYELTTRIETFFVSKTDNNPLLK